MFNDMEYNSVHSFNMFNHLTALIKTSYNSYIKTKYSIFQILNNMYLGIKVTKCLMLDMTK